MTPVSSSNLEAVGYDADQQCLAIAFRGGRLYEYFGVPFWEFAGLLAASSHGQYFHREIRECYDYRRVW